jgi:prepilin-type N-terminal cleavage/methylation domain-containing protein
MSNRRAFTLIELLVVIAIVAILMAILMPALNRVRNQARTVGCQSSLHQWTLIWSMYTTDNNGRFIKGQGGENQTGLKQWVTVMRTQYKDLKMRTCPMAYKVQKSLTGATLNPQSPFVAWGYLSDGSYGSYGLNEWVCDRDTGTAGGEFDNYWHTVNVKPASKIPTFLDCYWYDVWAHDVDKPPQNINDVYGAGTDEMKRVCLDRHNHAINCAFIDWSIRKVDLKELWTLKWHRTFNNVNNHWMKAGGATPDQWPLWMRGFKDY